MKQPMSQRVTMRRSTFRHIKFKNGYRSGLEATVADQLTELGVEFEYEKQKIPYQIDAKYIPDFVLPNGIIIECKGRFTSEDRRKMRLVKEQNPELDIRFIFTRCASKINKGSKTSYADWCEKYEFKYADKLIPGEWIYDKTGKTDSAPEART
jgi:hypothetical protein